MKARPVVPGEVNEAIFSPCGNYRHWLARMWRSNPGSRLLAWCMLNPSTATKETNDPTVHGCEVRTRLWGFDGMIVVNGFDLTATDPKAMLAHPEPLSADNDAWILQAAIRADAIVCAWGNHVRHHKRYPDRERDLLAILRKHAPTRLLCLKINAATGCPAHPLYLGYKLKPKPLLESSAADNAAVR